MKKLLPLIILISAGVGFAQTSTKQSGSRFAKQTAPVCDLTVNEAPNLRGMFLGQSFQDIARLIPGFEQIYLATEGETYFKQMDLDVRLIALSDVPSSIYPHSIAGYEDVFINWHFLDGKLIRLFVTYTEFEPKSIHDLIGQVAEKSSLPRSSFVIKNKYNADLNCKGFSVSLNMGMMTRFEGPQASWPQVTVEDREAASQIKKREDEIRLAKKLETIRMNKEKEKRRRVFLP